MALRALKVAGQTLVFAAFATVVGYFSAAPSYDRIPSGKALITLSFNHVGARRFECRRLSPEEIAALPPNMRRPEDCPRERVPLLLEVRVDGAILAATELQPVGLARDGPSSVYRNFLVEPGRHQLELRLRDTPRTDGYDHAYARAVDVVPGQHIVIDFKPDKGGFQIL